MLLTQLFKYIISVNLELSNDRYVLYDHVMYPLVVQQERKTQKDYSMKRGRHSTFSSSAFDQPSSSHLNDDDDDDDGNDEGTSHASTPSPTHFVNSLSNDISQVNREGHHELVERKEEEIILEVIDLAAKVAYRIRMILDSATLSKGPPPGVMRILLVLPQNLCS
ncbi:hypothetical protein Tco_0675719 [Tanacetum coccineum]